MTGASGQDCKQYHESSRRKELERQYRESVARPVKEDLEEVIRRLTRIEEKLDEELRQLLISEGDSDGHN